MAILLSSLCTLAFGVIIVLLSSPTFNQSIFEQQHWALVGHAILVDVLFAFLISYVLLCHIEHKWIAQELSFPYSCQLPWNFGHKAFDFQLLTFELFHIKWLSRTTHVVTITIEVAMWFYTINATFGWLGLVPLLIFLSAQAVSYRDPALGFVLCTIYSAFALSANTLRTSLPEEWLGKDMLVLKTALLYVGTIQTLCHALEPLPPTYDEHLKRFDDNFGSPGWGLIFANPFRATWLFALGQVSELSAGLPGRYFSQIVYKLMFKMGYRSRILQDVSDIKRQGMSIIHDGWQAHETTRAMYSWATNTEVTLFAKEKDETGIAYCD